MLSLIITLRPHERQVCCRRFQQCQVSIYSGYIYLSSHTHTAVTLVSSSYRRRRRRTTTTTTTTKCISAPQNLVRRDFSKRKHAHTGTLTHLYTTHNLQQREVKIQTHKKHINERLFILTRTHSNQIFGEIPFIKPQNDT